MSTSRASMAAKPRSSVLKAANTSGLGRQRMLDAVFSELDVVLPAGLLEDAGAVRADGLDREVHGLGDLGRRTAPRHELHDAMFLRRQQLVRQAPRRAPADHVDQM